MQKMIFTVVRMLLAATRAGMTTLFAYVLPVLLLGAYAPADAARSLRETLCIEPGAMALDAQAVSQIGKLIAGSAPHEPAVGTFISVFVRDDSLAALGDGVSAVTTLIGHLKTAERKVRNWPVDLKFFPLADQCSSGRVLIELSISFEETPLSDPKR
jgi:hypothetical protein